MRTLNILLMTVVLLLISVKHNIGMMNLSEKQKQNGWYLEYETDDIAKVMHPVYGYLKHVSLKDRKINLEKS